LVSLRVETTKEALNEILYRFAHYKNLYDINWDIKYLII